MIPLHKVLVMILAGGKGERLEPLTRDRTKPAVPFGGVYRIIDMTLSNCVNSSLRKIWVLTQYMSRSLSHHLRESWRFISRPALGEFVEPLPPQYRLRNDWYQGTAAALHQNLGVIERENPEILLVLAGDHIYKMDYRLMLDFHERMEADMVVGAVEIPIQQASSYGIIEVDADNKIVDFQEKPADPKPMPGRPDMVLASMGIYTFRPKCLRKALEADAQDPASSRDIGRDIVGRMRQSCRVFAFPFVDANKKTSNYWRDVGTIDSYWTANMDLVSVDPEFNLYDADWPIFAPHIQAPPPKFVFAQEEPGGRLGTAMDSLVSSGCILSGGRIKKSVLSPFVRVNSYAHVEDSILFDNVTIGRHAEIRKAIIDKDVHVPEGMKIGVDLEEDRKHFFVSPGGVVVIPKGAVLKPSAERDAWD